MAKPNFRARALLVGERLDLRSMEGVERWASEPVTLSAGACGVAMLFRYGAIVALWYLAGYPSII